MAIISSSKATDAARVREQTAFPAAVFTLPAQDRGRIRILAKRMRIAAGQNLHHPVIEIIHRMRLDGLKPAIVFFMGLLNVITQSET
jgi:hypothetical protein